MNRHLRIVETPNPRREPAAARARVHPFARPRVRSGLVVALSILTGAAGGLLTPDRYSGLTIVAIGLLAWIVVALGSRR